MDQSRRDFLIRSATVGSAMVLATSLPHLARATPNPRPWHDAAPDNASEFSPWVTIGSDDIVTVRVPTPEIGNGVMTQVLMTLTEELYCDWSKVRAEYASPNRNQIEGNVYGNAGGFVAFFSGRSTIPVRTQALLQAGASARERLKEAAAQTWGVPRAEIEARDSRLTHARSARTCSYGEMAAKAGLIRLDVEPAPKPPADWWFLGKASPPKVHLPLVTNGSAIFGIDVQLPDMVYAALMQAPVHGGKLRRYDFEKIRHMPGVRGVAVVDPAEPRSRIDPKLPPFPLEWSAPQSGIAVIADHYWQARKALEALPIEWDDGPGVQWQTDAQTVDAIIEALGRPGKVVATRGKPLEVLATEPHDRWIEAQYVTPFCDHVTMEPLNGTALVTADRVDVWHPTQHGQQALFIAAQEAGLPPEQVHIHPTFVGGGFGRRAYGDDLRMVVAIAKKFAGRPVKVIWSREESMRQGRYRPLQAARMHATLGHDGLPRALHIRTAGSPGLETRFLADGPHASGAIEHVQVESGIVPITILGGPYRGPGYNSNAFFVDTFIDECAAAAKIDPLEYRLKLYAKWPDPGWTLCLKEVATKARWGRKLPKGWGQGIAITNWGMLGKPEAGTTVAAVVTTEVTADGALRIDAIDVAFDSGQVFNRDAVIAQIESGVIFSLNTVLNEKITVANGRIVEGNYHQYPMLRIGDVPKQIGVHFGGLTGHSRVAEIGEPPAGPVPPALGNAIFRATGKRLRSTPFRLHDLGWT